MEINISHTNAIFNFNTTIHKDIEPLIVEANVIGIHIEAFYPKVKHYYVSALVDIQLPTSIGSQMWALAGKNFRIDGPKSVDGKFTSYLWFEIAIWGTANPIQNTTKREKDEL